MRWLSRRLTTWKDRPQNKDGNKADYGNEHLVESPGAQGGGYIHAHESADEPEAGVVDEGREDGTCGGGEHQQGELNLVHVGGFDSWRHECCGGGQRDGCGTLCHAKCCSDEVGGEYNRDAQVGHGIGQCVADARGT